MRLLSSCDFECQNLNLTAASSELKVAEKFRISTMMIYASFLMSGIMTLFTIFANALTIFVLVNHRPLQKSISNLYILSLSIADAIIGFFVMPVMLVYQFVQSLENFFGPLWLCNIWQIADFAVSTISLYSICAIAIDRFWNLEKPLRVFKRSRRIAQRLITAMWITPFLIWTGVYYFFNRREISPNALKESSDTYTTKCYTKWTHKYVPIIIAAPVVYIPVIILIAIFIRIAMVVQHHMKFLRENANNPSASNVSAWPEIGHLVNSNSNSKTRENFTKSSELQRKLTDNSLATVTSEYYTLTIRTPRCQSPRMPKPEWNLAPLSEEKSSGRERSHSEQIQSSNPKLRELEKNNCWLGQFRVESTVSVPTRKESLQANELLMINRNDTFLKKTTSDDNFFRTPSRFNWFRFSMCSTDSTVTNHCQSMESRKMSQLSTRSKRGSKRFSIIPLPHNILELIHREGVSQQVRAAKAVALILFCFLLCWLPFLVLWPIKIYCNQCIPDNIYMTSIWLNYVGSALNPVVYTLSSPRARTALRQYLNQRSKLRCKQSMFRSIIIA